MKIKIIAAIVILIVIVVGVSFIVKSCNKEQEVNITNVNISTETIKVQEIVTLKYEYKDFTHYEKEGKDLGIGDIKIPFTSDECLILYGGTISIGFEADNVTIKRNEEKKTFKVEVPDPVILAHTPNDDVSDIYDIKNSITSHINPGDTYNNYQNLVADLRKEKEKEALADEDVIADAIEQYKTFWESKFEGYTINFVSISDNEKNDQDSSEENEEN